MMSFYISVECLNTGIWGWSKGFFKLFIYFYLFVSLKYPEHFCLKLYPKLYLKLYLKLYPKLYLKLYPKLYLKLYLKLNSLPSSCSASL
jgi:hypothetical protein